VPGLDADKVVDESLIGFAALQAASYSQQIAVVFVSRGAAPPTALGAIQSDRIPNVLSNISDD
jgi:hypothetical protein